MTISRNQLVELLESGAQLDPTARSSAVDLLRALEARDLSTREVDAAVLRRIYAKRADHAPDDVFGTPELVAALAAMRDDRVACLSVAEDGMIIDVWMDLELTEVVGCVVAPDRRVPPTPANSE